MKFRPCIDIHNGKVKQIVGGSLTDVQDQASENFVSEQDASFYAELYKKAGIKGGHVILLNGHDSPYYESTKEQAILALHTYPGGLQIGGGVNPENAGEYLSAGASHVIVTSYVFKDGRISWENLNKMKETVGKEKLVLDLSCRRKDGKYYIVTDRWQKFTDVTMTLDIMKELGSYCDEFLVHAVDVEGKARGVETELASLLGEYKGNPVTYAGGVGSMKDIEDLRKYGKDRLDVTVGSALDLFGAKKIQCTAYCDIQSVFSIFSQILNILHGANSTCVSNRISFILPQQRCKFCFNSACLSLHIYCMDQKLIAVTSQFFHNIQCHSDICKFLPAVCHNIVFSIFSATAQVKNQFLFSHSLFHFVQIFPRNPSIFKYIRCNDYMTGTCTKIFPCIFRVHSSADL